MHAPAPFEIPHVVGDPHTIDLKAVSVGAGGDSWATKGLVPHQGVMEGEDAQVQQHTLCVKVMICGAGSRKGALERWGECSVRVAVRPPVSSQASDTWFDFEQTQDTPARDWSSLTDCACDYRETKGRQSSSSR